MKKTGVSDPDGDGVANPDPQCGQAFRNRERTTCGLGFELALLLLARSWLPGLRARKLAGLLILALALLPGTPGIAAEAAPPVDPSAKAVFQTKRLEKDRVTVRWNTDRLRAAAPGRTARVRGFPLDAERSVDLDLERFTVTTAKTRFVIGRKGRPDVPLDFDPSQITLLRGTVVGRPDSHVFLALGAGQDTGSIDLGDGSGRYRLGSRDPDGRRHAPGTTSVFRLEPAAASATNGPPPSVPFCGNADADADGSADVGPPDPARGLRHMELAVETDFEFFSLFGDATEASAYLVALYGELSAVFVRDQRVWVDLVFARIWDDPNDLFNDVDPSPLGDFRSYWNANMGSVQRDVAQLLSGRRDYAFGGQAYLSTLCSSSAYSVVGYAVGFFPDPTQPSPYHYDIAVTSHELGHNSGTGHTHSSPNFIDTCDDPFTTPQRGSIMSYCGQTWSGGNANRDLYFHTRIGQNIESHVSGSSCIVQDCNVNGVADATDISSATSLDVDSNGVPDECEDCNQNLVLDDQDIASATSLDLDNDDIPDECQPDCNTNNVPDRKDIADGTSLDAHGNAVPDECEVDCNGNFLSDYSEIQADMTLDVDRNAVLDACQDCDIDGTSDLDALGGAHGLWLATGHVGHPIRRFYASTGVLTGVSSGAIADVGHDLVVSPDGHVLVSSSQEDRVLEFDGSGVFLGDRVPAGLGGLDLPNGLALSPTGVLMVASENTNSVLAFGPSGQSMGAFVASGAGGLTDPFGLTFGPNGNLFVTSGGDEVLEYDGFDGSFVQTFVSSADNGGLDQARGLTFKADGNLLVASYGTDQTLEFDGTTGASLGRWALSGNDSGNRLNQVSPWGLRVGPNGNVFIVRTGEAFGSGGSGEHHEDEGGGELHLTNAQIYEFDVSNGNFIRAHVNGNDHGHEFPTGLDFIPGEQDDCNVNRLPDSCDISSGSSADVDVNGIPDECEIDCNANGLQDRLDIIPFGSSLDCNFNRIPDECDLAAGTPGACSVACNDGVDSDGDGLVDYPEDLGCRGAADDSEHDLRYVCDDGIDNDSDGDKDFPADPGCWTPVSFLENPQCQDGQNNDGDGLVDFDGGESIHGACTGAPGGCPAGVSDPDGNGVANPDPQCNGVAYRNSERASRCGLGFELAGLLPLLGAWSRRRRAGRPGATASPAP